MAWVNSWQRAEAISATEQIIGEDASIEEYSRVLDILERSFGNESDAIRVLLDWKHSTQRGETVIPRGS